MKPNKIGTLFLISILALSAIGVSYAGFTDEIIIKGTIRTGTVDLKVMEIVGTWVYKLENHGILVKQDIANPDGSDPSPPADMVELVAYVNATVDSEDDDLVTATWHNLFPLEGLGDYKLAIRICYTGSIPARIININAEITSGEAWIEELIQKEYISYGLFYDIISKDPIPVEECDQVHQDDCMWLSVISDIEQNNSFQGLSGSVSFSIDVIQWNEADCEEENNDKIITLPPEPVYINLSEGTDSYFEALIRGIGGPSEGYNVWDGNWIGWCVDQYHEIETGVEYLAMLYSTYDPANPWPDDDWDMVNWIINHKSDYPTATGNDFQEAIWYFVNGGNMPSTAIGIQIVNDAIMYGEGFVPSTGQWIAVVCYISEDVQKIFIEVDP